MTLAVTRRNVLVLIALLSAALLAVSFVAR